MAEKGDREKRIRKPINDAASSDVKEKADSDGASVKESRSKPPVILAKPPVRRIVNDDEEEWPSISTAASRTSSGGPGTPNRLESPRRTIRSEEPLEESAPARSESSRRTVNALARSKIEREPPLPPTSSSLPASSKTDRMLRGGIKMVTENMDWNDSVLEHLSEHSNEFLVVGVLGTQGSGKSTVMSFLAGNDPADPYRNYIFRPETKDAVETGQHQTNGIQLYVGEERIIFLDCQPILSPCVLDYMIQYDNKYSMDYGVSENALEIQSLEIASFMLQVCHLVLVVVDYFVDLNLLRFLRNAEMLKPGVPLNDLTNVADHFPVVAFVHNKATRADFASHSIEAACQLLNKMLSQSKLLYNENMNFWLGPQCSLPPGTIGASTNLFLLPEVNFWLKHKFPEKQGGYKGHPEYEKLIRDMRRQVLSLPRPLLSASATSEKAWFVYAGKMWDAVKKSLLISEYGRMLS